MQQVRVKFYVCTVEVYATGWSLVQRSPTTVARRCVWSRHLVNEESLVHWGLLRQKQTNILAGKMYSIKYFVFIAHNTWRLYLNIS